MLKAEFEAKYPKCFLSKVNLQYREEIDNAFRIITGQTTHLVIDANDMLRYLCNQMKKATLPISLDSLVVAAVKHICLRIDERPNLLFLMIAADNPVNTPAFLMKFYTPTRYTGTHYSNQMDAASFTFGKGDGGGGVRGEFLYKSTCDAAKDICDPYTQPLVYSYIFSKVILQIANRKLLKKPNQTVFVCYPLLQTDEKPLLDNMVCSDLYGNHMTRLSASGIYIGQSSMKAMSIFRMAFKESVVSKACARVEIHTQDEDDDMIPMLLTRYLYESKRVHPMDPFTNCGVTLMSIDNTKMVSIEGIYRSIAVKQNILKIISYCLLYKTCSVKPKVDFNLLRRLGQFQHAFEFTDAIKLKCNFIASKLIMLLLFAGTLNAQTIQTQCVEYWNSIKSRYTIALGTGDNIVNDNLPFSQLRSILLGKIKEQVPKIRIELTIGGDIYISPDVDYGNRFTYDEKVVDVKVVNTTPPIFFDATAQYPGDISDVTTRRRFAMMAWMVTYYTNGDLQCFSGSCAAGDNINGVHKYDMDKDCQLSTLLLDAGFLIEKQSRFIALVTYDVEDNKLDVPDVIEIYMINDFKQRVNNPVLLSNMNYRYKDLMHAMPLFVDVMVPTLEIKDAQTPAGRLSLALQELTLCAADKIAFLNLAAPEWPRLFAEKMCEYAVESPSGGGGGGGSVIFPNAYICLLYVAAIFQLRADGIQVDFPRRQMQTFTDTASRLYQAPINIFYSLKILIDANRYISSVPLYKCVDPIIAQPPLHHEIVIPQGRHAVIEEHRNAFRYAQTGGVGEIDQDDGGGGGGDNLNAITLLDMPVSKPGKEEEICFMLQKSAVYYNEAISVVGGCVPGRVVYKMMTDGGALNIASIAEIAKIQLSNCAVASGGVDDYPAFLKTISSVREICDYAQPLLVKEAKDHPRVYPFETGLLKDFIQATWLALMRFKMSCISPIDPKGTVWMANKIRPESTVYAGTMGNRSCIWPFAFLGKNRSKMTIEETCDTLHHDREVIMALCSVLPITHDMQVSVSDDRKVVVVFFIDWDVGVTMQYIRQMKSLTGGNTKINTGKNKYASVLFYNVCQV
jgi:hypothetical protein